MKVDKLKMTEMWSQQGEKVPFDKPVEAKGVACAALAFVRVPACMPSVALV